MTRANHTPAFLATNDQWERLWHDARIIRDRIEAYLARSGILTPLVFIRECQPLHPKPCFFTFVSKIDEVKATTVVSVIEIDDNSDDIGVFAQAGADFAYQQLVDRASTMRPQHTR